MATKKKATQATKPWARNILVRSDLDGAVVGSSWGVTAGPPKVGNDAPGGLGKILRVDDLGNDRYDVYIDGGTESDPGE